MSESALLGFVFEMSNGIEHSVHYISGVEHALDAKLGTIGWQNGDILPT